MRLVLRDYHHHSPSLPLLPSTWGAAVTLLQEEREHLLTIKKMNILVLLFGESPLKRQELYNKQVLVSLLLA
jgi:hypothetical protein